MLKAIGDLFDRRPEWQRETFQEAITRTEKYVQEEATLEWYEFRREKLHDIMPDAVMTESAVDTLWQTAKFSYPHIGFHVEINRVWVDYIGITFDYPPSGSRYDRKRTPLEWGNAQTLQDLL